MLVKMKEWRCPQEAGEIAISGENYTNTLVIESDIDYNPEYIYRLDIEGNSTKNVVLMELISDNQLSITLSADMLGISGIKSMQLRATNNQNKEIKKSNRFYVLVADAIFDGTEDRELPSEFEEYEARIDEKIRQAEALEADVSADVEQTETGAIITVRSHQTETQAEIFNGEKGERGERGLPGQKGDSGNDGQDGFSPIVSTAIIPGGHTIEITDATHTDVINVMDGNDGNDGNDGQDGISPTVAVQPISGGNEVSITDRTGAHIFNVMDGVNGIDGTDGTDGEDGYTPVRGVDYWTNSDKQDIVDDVLASLPTWTGGAY